MTNNEKKMKALQSLGIASTIRGDEFIVHTEEPIPSDEELLSLYDEIIAKEDKDKKDKLKAKQDAKTKLKKLKSKGKDFEELVDSFATLLNIDLDKEEEIE